MKLPAKIFVIQESVRISPSKSPAIIGDWATTETFAHDTEYIRRDVVEEVIADILWRHRKGFEYIDTFQAKAKEILEEIKGDIFLVKKEDHNLLLEGASFKIVFSNPVNEV